MTTTQPLPNQGLAAEIEEDTMQMGTSPYIELGDIDIELDDDDREHSIEDNSMIDDATENMDPMQQDNSAANQDDFMYEEMVDEDLLDFEDDDDEKVSPDDRGVQNGNTLTIEDNSVSGIPQKQEPAAILDPEGATTVVEDEHRGLEGGDVREVRAQATEAEANEEEEVTNTVYIDPDTLTDRLPDESTQSKSTSSQSPGTNRPTPRNVASFARHTKQDGTSASNAEQEPQDFTAEDANQAEVQLPSTGQAQANEGVDELAEAARDAAQGTAASAEDTHGDESRQTAQQESTSVHLHPIIVNYMEQDYSLFPPENHDDATTYLLQDHVLASQPFEKLLSACRDLIGEGLGHDDEMVIDIPTLGLHICEDSKYASQLTMAQVVDTYMLLSQNEQLSSIEPLYCRLSHRVCLESQMSYLITSAREGKFYTTIAEEHIGSPEEEQGLGDHGDPPTWYDTADAYDDQAAEALDDPVEIQESKQDLAYEPKHGEQAEEDEAGIAIADTAEPIGGDEPGTGLGASIADHLDAALPEEDATPVIQVTEQGGDAASQSDRTVDHDDSATAQQDATHAHDPATEAQDNQVAAEKEQYDLGEEEDLFADDDDPGTRDALPVDATNGNDAAADVGYEDGHQNGRAVFDAADAADAADELVEWDIEEEQQQQQQQDTNSAAAPPATPSKAIIGKRKLEDDEDYLIDLDDTPGAKRSRSS